MLDAKDDLRHPLRPVPHARESLFYNILLAEEDLMVFIYTWVDAENKAGHLFAVVGDNNERHAFSAVDGVDIGSADFDDWEVQGLRLRHTDLLRTAELGVTSENASLTAQFTALHDAFDYVQNEDGCPEFVADNRFEQAVRVTGELTLNGRTIPFDTTGHRDHSWGVRDWNAMQDWKWVSAQTADGTALNIMVLHGRGETTRHGYVFRDGELSPVAQVRTRAQYDKNWWQTDLDMSVTDAAGRQTQVVLHRYALLVFGAADLSLHEAGCRATINGQDAVAHFECGWDRRYVEAQVARLAGGH
ncbi:MAG TPA: DUF2804 family protein [Pseudonocardia sp.]|jgi:hypothetical protein|nr:DUF2804 family protein [Pseudonocardia sp.]